MEKSLQQGAVRMNLAKKMAVKPGEIAVGSPRANEDRLAMGKALGTLP